MKKSIFALFCVVAFVLCALNANSVNDDFSKAQELEAKKDYDGALEIYAKSCENGSFEGCKKAEITCDEVRAQHGSAEGCAEVYMDMACDKSHAQGCYEMGEFYLYGNWGSYRNNVEGAIEAFSKGCALNHGASCAFLGDIYGGDDEELNKAVEYASKTLKAYLVKENYLKIIDKNKANEYYKKACELGEKRACERL